MNFDHRFLEHLRRRLLSRGTVSLVPRSFSTESASPEGLAAYDRTLPFAQAMFLVMSADGVIEDTEREVLRGAIRTLSGGHLGSTALESMISRFERELLALGQEVALDDVAARLWGHRDDRELALALVGAMVVDDTSDQQERRVILELAERLGVSRDDALALLDGK